MDSKIPRIPVKIGRPIQPATAVKKRKLEPTTQLMRTEVKKVRKLVNSMPIDKLDDNLVKNIIRNVLQIAQIPDVRLPRVPNAIKENLIPTNRVQMDKDTKPGSLYNVKDNITRRVSDTQIPINFRLAKDTRRVEKTFRYLNKRFYKLTQLTAPEYGQCNLNLQEIRAAKPTISNGGSLTKSHGFSIVELNRLLRFTNKYKNINIIGRINNQEFYEIALALDVTNGDKIYFLVDQNPDEFVPRYDNYRCIGRKSSIGIIIRTRLDQIDLAKEMLVEISKLRGYRDRSVELHLNLEDSKDVGSMLEKLSKLMELYAQIIINIKCIERPTIASAHLIWLLAKQTDCCLFKLTIHSQSTSNQVISQITIPIGNQTYYVDNKLENMERMTEILGSLRTSNYDKFLKCLRHYDC